MPAKVIYCFWAKCLVFAWSAKSCEFTIWILDTHTFRYSGVRYSDGYCICKKYTFEEFYIKRREHLRDESWCIASKKVDETWSMCCRFICRAFTFECRTSTFQSRIILILIFRGNLIQSLKTVLKTKTERSLVIKQGSAKFEQSKSRLFEDQISNGPVFEGSGY